MEATEQASVGQAQTTGPAGPLMSPQIAHCLAPLSGLGQGGRQPARTCTQVQEHAGRHGAGGWELTVAT